MATKKVVKKPAKKVVVKKALAKTLRINVGRFGEDPVVVNVKAPATVSQVLEKAGFTLAAADKVWVNGKRSTKGAKVKAGDFLSVISQKQAG